ncbi:MAG TPA: metalloregulator ArsR/SmtB family transcription factor [Clostridia bacterium]|jgi:ArsR family transcriptional regulator|nr:MAG: Transcriptional repressor SdpR [Firmicutes bacterium ADurb.Bin146]HOD93783.1 metalloregulator ArsR/SmtB family transcription factor [Clostridia bacterium]HQM39120.1 metalloregulator ArsR/SmtB family transcription factor [Clostridia bacterium]
MKDKYKQEIAVFKALSDENRLKILDLLSDGQKCACIILEKLDITQPTLSHHMKILFEAGLIDKLRQGKWTHYSLSKKGGHIPRRLADLYSSVE